ncbi:uncharacterized protein [Venturia canescens]|uniref:uncharacterized protein n=1 Tax=Venturia canescens TaxID=32260 RepID=UPI001C9D61DC|nr:uncharacterized protein LOC122417319 [Venturia canescens]
MSTTITENQEQPQNEESCYYKWTDHQTHLSDVVRQLLEEECMVDVTLVADGERIQAHRIVLCSCSTLFQEIFSQTNEEHATIILSDISAQDVRSIVEFSYHGEVRTPVENISNLLEAAHSLRICGLMEIDGLDENDAIISVKDSKDESGECFEDFEECVDNDTEMLDDDPHLYKEVKQSCEGIEKVMSNKGKKRQKSNLKRDYNDEMLASAINDLKLGQTLVEASIKNNIPRSTLYMRAKALGIQLNASRNEYPAECMKAAIDAVIEGSSLQHASDKFFIPKTVLWRRIQKEGYQILRTGVKRAYGQEKRDAAVKALQRGENLTKVAQQFQIPKTTLFREKVKLVDEGKLPESFWKKRKTGNEEWKKMRLEEAVALCKEGKMSQAAAAMKYRIPKTTIWRRLQQEGKSTARENVKTAEHSLNEYELSGKTIQDNSEFALCEVSSEIPMTYIDSNLPADSVIILTTEDVDGLNLDENRQLMVNQDSEYVQCALAITDDAEASGYPQAES